MQGFWSDWNMTCNWQPGTMLAPIKIYFDYRKVLRRIDMFFL
jgi:hypothetical protein